MDAFTQWRKLAGQHLGRGRGRRYPVPLRRAAAELARRGLAHGMSMRSVTQALDVPGVTLRGWMDAGELVPVTVVEDPSTRVRLMVGRGHVDLTVAELTALLWSA